MSNIGWVRSIVRQEIWKNNSQWCYIKYEITGKVWLVVATVAARRLPSPVFCRKLQIFQIYTFLKPQKIFPLRILKSVSLFCEKMSDIPWIEKCSPTRDLKGVYNT